MVQPGLLCQVICQAFVICATWQFNFTDLTKHKHYDETETPLNKVCA